MFTGASIGKWIVFTSVTLYCLFVLWVGVSPFIKEDHPTLSILPDRLVGVAIPSVALSLIVLFVYSYMSYLLIRDDGCKGNSKINHLLL